ncbi:hypothetical protein, partial [Streptomyces sp. SID3343]|uniref:hypothetical protein n=1 Tax=Streptomyces sp. SID3343 TaxID=2690260 RepID=UPI0013BEBD0D
AAGRLDTRRRELASAHADATRRHDSCADTLREAEAAGHTTAALAAAGAVLALAPQRLAALQREQVRLADER